MTSQLNFMKIYQLVQKLLVRNTDGLADKMVISFFLNGRKPRNWDSPLASRPLPSTYLSTSSHFLFRTTSDGARCHKELPLFLPNRITLQGAIKQRRFLYVYVPSNQNTSLFPRFLLSSPCSVSRKQVLNFAASFQ
jgi:hypothetical protein